MNFEEWYAKLSEWAEENTALNMSYAMQRHLARRLEEWESSRPTSRALDGAKWNCPKCNYVNFSDERVCIVCETAAPVM